MAGWLRAPSSNTQCQCCTVPVKDEFSLFRWFAILRCVICHRLSVLSTLHRPIMRREPHIVISCPGPPASPHTLARGLAPAGDPRSLPTAPVRSIGAPHGVNRRVSCFSRVFGPCAARPPLLTRPFRRVRLDRVDDDHVVLTVASAIDYDFRV